MPFFSIFYFIAHRNRVNERATRIAMLTIVLVSCFAQSIRCAGQTKVFERPSQSEAQTELQRRLDEARAAQASGVSNRLKAASERLIALALREMAQLRLLESAYAESAELYRRSLDFEEHSDTRVDLAIAEIGRFNADGAIAQLDPVLEMHPNDVRALTAAGRAWTLKKDYGKAAEYLGRAATLAPSVDSLYSWATCLLSSKDQKQRSQASEVFDRMVKVAGDTGSLHVMFGRAYRDAGDMRDAVREFQRAIAIDTHTPHAHYFLGLARLSMNEWAPTPEVRDEFLAELNYFPRDYLANYMLGYVDSVEHKYPEANQRLKLAAEIDATTPEPWLYLGLNSHALGDEKTAESSLRKSIALTGENESRAVYQVRRAYVTLGRILMASDRSEEGEKCLAKGRQLQNKVLELSQQQIGAHLLEGGGAAAVVLPPTNEEEKHIVPTQKAPIDPFGKIDQETLVHSSLTTGQKLQAEREEQALRSVLGFGFSELGISEAMAKVYRSSLSHFQEAERWSATIPGLYRNLGVAAYRADNYPEATRALALALAEKPNDPPVRAMLGMAYYASDRYRDAVNVFSPLGADGMRDPLAGYAWAASLARLGDLKHATTVLVEMERNELPAETLLIIGQLWTDMADYSRAVQSFHIALDRDPSLTRAHYFAGLAQLHWNHTDEAITEFNAALKLAPDDPDAKIGLGYVYLQQAKRAEAMELFRSVIATKPENGNAHYQLGKLLLDGGSVKEAVAHLEEAARKLPQTDYVHYQLQVAYRKEARTADADRELQIYKELKAKNRELTIPRPMERP